MSASVTCMSTTGQEETQRSNGVPLPAETVKMTPPSRGRVPGKAYIVWLSNKCDLAIRTPLQ